MKYGIVQNHQFVLIDTDLQRLKNTLLFLPQYSADQIKSYEDSEIEQCHDGNWYEKGHASKQPLHEARAVKLEELNAAFTSASQTTHCMSSAGFEINADVTANLNISGLIITMEASGTENVSFCDYNNNFHDVTLLDLKTMQLEVIQNKDALYMKKWLFREAINDAETIEELNAIEISFAYP